MTDEVAIVTRAKENMMFAMATLSMDQRRKMSYTKEEFIHKCSFNGLSPHTRLPTQPHQHGWRLLCVQGSSATLTSKVGPA